MKPLVVGCIASAFFAAFSIASGCAHAPPALPKASERPPVTASASAVPSSPIATHISPPRPAPPVVVEPMPGAPDDRALAEARLVGTNCEDAEAAARRQAETRLKHMIEEVDARWQEWKQGQPMCWEMYRQQAAEGWPVGSGHGRLGGSHKSSAASARPGPVAMSGGASAAGPAGNKSNVSGRSAPTAASASGTNNQVAGVDEADIVKTDGRYVYLAMNGALRIVEAMRPQLLSVTSLQGAVREMFIEGDRAVVYVAYGGNGRGRCTYGYDCQFAGDGSSTKIVVLDVRDRLKPRIVREVGLSGSLVAARRVGATVHTVVSDGDSAGPVYTTWPQGMGLCGMSNRAARAKFEELKRENRKKILADISLPVIRDLGVDKPLCDNLLRTPMGDGEAYTTVVSFDVRADNVPASTATLQSRPGAVFASASGLYLSTVHRKADVHRGWFSFYASKDEVSDVHKFSIGERPSETRYVGSGTVPGHVLNQFAMDEYYGYLRIATTSGKAPQPDVSSSVSVLAQAENGNLVLVGAVDGIATGEDIRAVRFDDDRGYVVTFKKTDPLFVLDLYHPAHPKILGELEIPGFSTYMHRIDPDHLLSIGFDANDQGSFAFFDGIILQLFDVKEPTEPRLLHKERIGTRGSSSEAAMNHLAFNYFGERGLLAIPMTVCEGGGNGRFGSELTFSGLFVYGVSVENGFNRLGGIDHGQKGAHCNAWWSQSSSQVKRSIFLDDLVYSIASDRLKVQRMGHFGEDVANISLGL